MKRKKRNLLLAAGAVSALVVTALFLTMTASAAKRGTMQPSCYPGNEFQIASGDTHAKLSNVYIQTSTFTLEPTFNGTETVVKGWVKAQMVFDAIDGGPLQGKASADFYAGSGVGHFESRCIAEGGTDLDGTEDGVPVTDNFEAEFEGTVTGLPWSKKPQKAIASFSGHKLANGDILLNFNVEQGTTCDEYTGEFGSSNAEAGPHKTSGTLNADNTDSARWGLPNGFDPSLTEPCPDVQS